VNTWDLIPHPKAPLMTDPACFKQALVAMSTGHVGEGERELLRQAGLVNLWFFGKFIAGYSGPFELWDMDFNLDMANYRQRALRPGYRGAMFLPRGCYKTSVVTEGGTAWELTRDPNLTVLLSHRVRDIAAGFRETARSVFANNELYAWLYPENALKKDEGEFIVPSRSRFYREESVSTIGVGGTSAGKHYGLIVFDDLHDVSDLDATFQSGIEVEKTKNWFWANEKTLGRGIDTRVLYVGTFYSDDDTGSSIKKVAHTVHGYALPGFEPNPKGNWEIYYRSIIEDGVITCPRAYTPETLAQMQRDSPWTYDTQIRNDTSVAGKEFSLYNVKDCDVIWDEKQGWLLEYWPEGESEPVLEKLSNMFVIQALDPAGSKKYVDARTSKSACVVVARSCHNDFFVIEAKDGYVEITKAIEWMFGHEERYEKYLRRTVMETQGAFKMLGPLVRTEEHNRGRFLALREVSATGDKEARIRTALQPLLDAGRLFVKKGLLNVVEQIKRFPCKQMDIVDALTMAINGSSRPIDEDAEWDHAMATQSRQYDKNPVTGY
jgi:hypothetical protein